MPGRSLLVALAAALALAGCDGSGDDGGGGRGGGGVAPAPDAVRTGIVALYTADDASATQLEEAGCFADALLERLDVDELRAVGIIGADGAVVRVLPVLDVPTAEEWVAAQGECADFVTVSTRAVVAQSRGEVDPELYEACLREALPGETADAAIVDTLTGRFDSAAVATLARAQAACSRAARPPG